MSQLDKDLDFCDPRCEPENAAIRMAERFELMTEALLAIREQVCKVHPDERPSQDKLWGIVLTIENIISEVD